MNEPEPPRGKLPDDERLFGAQAMPVLRTAAEELAWLTGRGYPAATMMDLVAERHALGARQRLAVERGICSDPQYRRRAVRELDVEDVQRRPLRIDAENLLVTIEVALAGGPLLRGLDGSVGDLVFRRGAHAPVSETDAALERIGVALRKLKPSVTRWYLLAATPGAAAYAERIVTAAARWKIGAEIKTADDVAVALGKLSHVVSSDPVVLDACGSWFNLAGPIAAEVPTSWTLTLQ